MYLKNGILYPQRIIQICTDLRMLKNRIIIHIQLQKLQQYDVSQQLDEDQWSNNPISVDLFVANLIVLKPGCHLDNRYFLHVSVELLLSACILWRDLRFTVMYSITYLDLFSILPSISWGNKFIMEDLFKNCLQFSCVASLFT